MLGPLNTFLGAAVHKHILKNDIYPLLAATHGVELNVSIIKSTELYIDGAPGKPFDLLLTIRKIYVRVIIDFFVGPDMLAMLPTDFIEAYLEFQVLHVTYYGNRRYSSNDAVNSHTYSCYEVINISY